MKLVLFTLFLFVSIASQAQCDRHFAHDPPKQRDIIPSTDPRVVEFHNLDCHYGCTAFVVAKGMIATAGHCISGSQYLVKFQDGAKRGFTVYTVGLTSGIGDDWALLTGDTRNIRPFALPEQYPSFPFSTFSEGFGQRGPKTYVRTIVVSKFFESDGAHYFTLIGKIDHGDSGGPLLGTDNTVLGIIVAMDWNNQNVGFASSYESFRMQIEDYKRNKK